MPRKPLLQVEGLKVHFPVRGSLLGPRRWLKAVDGVSFAVDHGETLGVVGESGCGKSTLGLAILCMTPINAGSVRFDGEEISTIGHRSLQQIRRRMQMVFQDPYGALNPRMQVLDIVGEPLKVHGVAGSRREYRQQVLELLDDVGLNPQMADRYPHEFSGGQRQRIGIARALALKPALIICDEPVSALDVSIQAQVINLLQDLQERLGLTYLFIAHDLAVVRHISNRIMVMYLGQVVEIADRDDLYRNPQHPYTQALLASIPIADPDRALRRRYQPVPAGEIPSPVNPPSGCAFQARCPHAMPICRERKPEMRSRSASHAVACHLQDATAPGLPWEQIVVRKAAASGE